MSDDLFPVPEVLSPKLAWLKKHRLETFTRDGHWVCANFGRTISTQGETEDEAIILYCEHCNLRHHSLE